LAHHKSAIKRIGQTQIRAMRNKAVKTRVKSIVKALRAAVEEKSKEKAVKELCTASSIIQKAAKKRRDS
jgi:small subunit ribosomal protein S20